MRDCEISNAGLAVIGLAAGKPALACEHVKVMLGDAIQR